MSLSPGTRLGPCEILSALGAGGMGELYRARDARLNRDVAIKVLPHLLVGDPERLARFQREAQVLASLNHPSIALTRTTITPSGPALTINGADRDLALSPDGMHVVYVGNAGTQLFVRGLDALEPVASASGGRPADRF